jgi:catalase
MLDPSDAVDRINEIYGAHPGHRALHARGTFYTGTFTATPEATELCRAAPFNGSPVPVLVRWSNGGGNPRSDDNDPDVRGMAVKLQGDGGDVDLVGQTSPRFPVKTPEDFLSFVAASRNQLTFPIWAIKHPATVPALIASLRARALGPPYSYAEISYYPIHAYGWLGADGTRSWVRFVLSPLDAREERPEGDFLGPHRLTDEVVARLENGPVRYDVRVTVAATRDDPHDPTSHWKGAREFSAGVIAVTSAVPDPEESGGPVVFDPTRIVDGIELSDDPILRYRPTAYSESVRRRTSG